MNIYFPDNVFTRSLASFLNKENQNNIIYSPSSILSKQLNDEPGSLALIPTLEIITNQDFFISRSIGLSFNGILSNSYIYYGKEQEQIDKVILTGDVSSMEVIICKILFNELFNTEVELNISTKKDGLSDQTHLIVGDDNFKQKIFERGISFAEEIVDLILAPYVNYVLASKDKELLMNYTDKVKSGLKDYDFKFSGTAKMIDEKSKEFINRNSKDILFNLEEQDIIGINELIRLPFYHGLLKELFDVKFV